MSTAYDQEKVRYLQHLEDDAAGSTTSGVGHAFETTPLFSLAVRHAAQASSPGKKSQPANGHSSEKIIYDTSDESKDETSSSEDDGKNSSIEQANTPCNKDVLSQYSLLGFHVGDHPAIGCREPIMLNTRAPNSTFLCGSQGSGKSYTLNCILEDYLRPEPKLGSVVNPVAGVAFHYDDDDVLNGAEVASLCSRGVKVTVLVSPSNFHKLKKAYEDRAKEAGGRVNIEMLRFKDEHLSISHIHKLMAFNESAENGVPLYVAIINNTLRQFAIDGRPFNLRDLEKKLKYDGNLMPTQLNLLEMRFDLLKSYLADDTKSNVFKKDIFDVAPGELTIVDLSDPFLDASMVCTLFDISLGLFKRNRPQDGLIVTLDEAHKYLNDSAGAERFTEHLITTVRMQRHHATRVVIATQEPTISGSLLDLCSVSIVHRFTSPAWFQSIKEHLSAASSLVASPAEQKALFEEIVKLGTGESFVFSPSSFVCLADGSEARLGTGVMKMKTRKRGGRDLGRSKMAGDVQARVIANGRVGKVKGAEASKAPLKFNYDEKVEAEQWLLPERPRESRFTFRSTKK